jgi:hypothetical protein
MVNLRADRPSNGQILEWSPLRNQLLVTDQAIPALLIGLQAVLVAQSGELLPQGVEDGMVVVQGSEANLQRLTEMEDRGWRRPPCPVAGSGLGRASEGAPRSVTKPGPARVDGQFGP